MFLRSLTKIFTILLSVKADNTEKIKQIVKFAINAVLNMVRTKLTTERIRRVSSWLLNKRVLLKRNKSYKIKMLLPERKQVDIKKKWTIRQNDNGSTKK